MVECEDEDEYQEKIDGRLTNVRMNKCPNEQVSE